MSQQTIRAFLHNAWGRCIAEMRVHPRAPEFLDHDGRRFELLEVTDTWARYAEPVETRA